MATPLKKIVIVGGGVRWLDDSCSPLSRRAEQLRNHPH